MWGSAIWSLSYPRHMRFNTFILILSPAVFGIVLSACEPHAEEFAGQYRVNHICSEADQSQIIITPTRYESGKTVCALSLENQTGSVPESWTFRLGKCTLNGEPHTAPGEGKQLVLTQVSGAEFMLSNEMRDAPIPLFKCPA